LGLARTLTLSIGPLAGGLLVALAGGFAVAFGLNAVTFVVYEWCKGALPSA
jgi:hypothetical protein